MKMLSAVEVGKMRTLADFLETVPPEDFDLGFWEERQAVARIAIGPIVFREGCGFAGCAMGWASHQKLFDGLKVKDDLLTYRGASDFKAAARLFGVTKNVAYFLFHESFYEGWAEPADVADRLRRFAAKVESRLARSVPRSLRLVGHEAMAA